ncbi:ferritin family protein [Thermococcus sp.]|uniref:ferritin-like domain-containing protein n=1 Tax=Thermococcus sp. TaxID=35749 RepID=UPI0025E66CC4|nr:ferritin family protein [Thermococcus sp.]
MVDLEGVSLLEELPLRELLAYWISLEGDKALLYEKLSEKAKGMEIEGAVCDMFKLLSQEARRHERKLRNLYTRNFEEDIPTVSGPSLEELSDIRELESENDVFAVLKCALELEEVSERIYSILAEKADDEIMKAVFRYLGSTERLHERAVESLIRDYRYHNGIKEGVKA